MGKAMHEAIKISFIKSFDNITTIPCVDAPITFRMPISLILLSTVNTTIPNNPRHDMVIARNPRNPQSFTKTK